MNAGGNRSGVGAAFPVVDRAAELGLDLEKQPVDLDDPCARTRLEQEVRLVRACQGAPRRVTMPSGSTASTTSPTSPIIHSRPIVGVENRVDHVGMPPSMANSTPMIPTSSGSQPIEWSGKRKIDPMINADADAAPELLDAGLHVDGEPDERDDEQGDGPPAGLEHVEAVAAGEQRAGTEAAGDTDARGEQFEDEQAEPDDEEQVGDRGRGERVELLLGERERDEPCAGFGDADRSIALDLHPAGRGLAGLEDGELKPSSSRRWNRSRARPGPRSRGRR